MTITAVVSARRHDKRRECPVSLPPKPSKLSAEFLKALCEQRRCQNFPEGSMLFQQGFPATGVYLVESGEVRILLPTGQRQRQLLEVVGTGTLLGLSETMSGERHRITAVAGGRTAAVYTPREEFFALLEKNTEFSVEILRLLSEDLHVLYHKFRSISSHPGRPRHRALDEQLN